MQTFRLQFSKLGDAKFLAHLDLMRAFSRAVKQGGLDVWYTEGFNSHIHLHFALPLALGLESICETVDVKLNSLPNEADLSVFINPFLPRGIEVFNAFAPNHKHTAIAFARYFVELEGDCALLTRLEDAFSSMMEQTEIAVERKNKKGVRTVDIRRQIHEHSLSSDDGRIVLDILVDAGDKSNLNPMLILNELYRVAGFEPEWWNIRRVQILTGSGENFV